MFDEVFHAEVQKRNRDFLSLAYYFLKGMWVVAPYYQFKSIMCIVDNLTKKDYDMSKPLYYKLNWFQRLHYWVFTNYGYLLKFSWYRNYANWKFSKNVWLMRYFPFLGYYYFGIKNATVNIGV